jgi:hypothetical protein
VPVTDELREEIQRRVHELGHDDVHAWAGTENYEMRVDPAGAWIDQQILDLLREATPGIDPG